MGSVRAFLTAFPDEPDRKLLIKTHSVNRTQDRRSLRIWSDICEVAAADPRVILLDKHLDNESYQALKAACDVYLSLHRAEGLGYHVLECMQLGIPCVVTDYSGTRDFSSDETAFPVTYDLVSVRPWEYPFSRGEQSWAEPRLDVAVQHLRMLANLPAKGLEVGLRARQFVHVAYSLPAFARRLDALLRPMISGAGSSVSDLQVPVV
jgi:glycosyltransferase involved in cell wall biosynthesis